MSSVKRSFSGTADLAATLQPWTVSPLLMRRGVFMGFQLGTALPVYLDVQYLKNCGYINTTTVKIFGDIRAGKTTFGKCLMHGMQKLQAGVDEHGNVMTRRQRGLVNDRDMDEDGFGEYYSLSQELLGRNVRLSESGEINLFDPRMCETEADYIRVATEITTDSKGAELDVLERLACQIASIQLFNLHPANRTTSAFELLCGQNSQESLEAYTQTVRDRVLEQVDNSLKSDNGSEGVLETITYGLSGEEYTHALEKYRQQFYTPMHIVTDPNMQQHFREASMRVSSYVGNLLRGSDYGGMFGDKTSVYDLLTDRFTVLDWNGVPEKATNLLEALIQFWVDVGLRRGDNTVTPDYMVSDEESSALHNPRHAQIRAERGRKSRKRRTVDVTQHQYVGDNLIIGEPGSELRRWGKVIHNTTGMYMVGSQQNSDDETLDIIMKMGVPDEVTAWHITRMPQGCWAVIMPNIGVDFMQHYVLPSQWRFAGSDTASRNAAKRGRVSEDAAAQARAQALTAVV